MFAGGFNYVRGMPTSMRDPFGLWSIGWGPERGVCSGSIGWGEPVLLFNQEDINDATLDGLAAWADGVNSLLGLGSPLNEMGWYSFSDPGIQASHFLGGVSLGSTLGGTSIYGLNAALGSPQFVYHYTSAAGYSGIMADKIINASRGLAGKGVYFSQFGRRGARWFNWASYTSHRIAVPLENSGLRPAFWPGSYYYPTNSGMPLP